MADRRAAIAVAASLAGGCDLVFEVPPGQVQLCEDIPYDSRRYELITTIDPSWREARDACLRRGWDLVTFETEQEFVLAGADFPSPYYVGLTDEVTEDQWESINVCPPVLLWGAVEPAGGTTENCGALFDDGMSRFLADVPCDDMVGIQMTLCELPRPTSPGCSNSNGLVPERYRIIPVPMPYTQAQMSCKDMAGHLVVIDDPEEAAYVAVLIGAVGLPEVWIGVNDLAVEGRWDSETGCPAFLPWAPNEPNSNTGDEDCAEAQPGGTTGLEINDDTCPNFNAYICELD